MEDNEINKYNININDERYYLDNKVLNKWIKYVTKCPVCKVNNMKLKKINSICNPYKMQCGNYKCRKIINLRNNTIFEYLNKTPISIIIKAIEKFILEETNATKTIN